MEFFIYYSVLFLLFIKKKGWRDIGECAFLGILVTMSIAVIYMAPENKRCNNKIKISKDDFALPEDRLILSMICSIFIPIGMF